MLIAEGDPYNTTKIRESRQNIQDLGYFKKVDLENAQGSAPDRSQININVEEQSTGSLTFGVGFSTSDGALFQTGIQERNLLGEGKILSLDLGVAQRKQTVNLGFTQRYFLDRDLDAGFDIFSTRNDRYKTVNYTAVNTGFALRTNFDYNHETSQNVYYRLDNRRISVKQSTVNYGIQEQEGTDLISTVGQTVSYDVRNSKIQPSDGFLASLSTDFTGLGGTVSYIRGLIRGAYYYNPWSNNILVVGGEMGAMTGIFGRKVNVADRFFLGGSNLRGFTDGGAGPIDPNGDSLGGKTYASQSTELRMPVGVLEEFGANFIIFNDLGYLSGTEEISSYVRDSRKLRASAGAGLSFNTPVGPMLLTIAKPYLQEKYDSDQFFRFDFRSRF